MATAKRIARLYKLYVLRALLRAVMSRAIVMNGAQHVLNGIDRRTLRVLARVVYSD